MCHSCAILVPSWHVVSAPVCGSDGHLLKGGLLGCELCLAGNRSDLFGRWENQGSQGQTRDGTAPGFPAEPSFSSSAFLNV